MKRSISLLVLLPLICLTGCGDNLSFVEFSAPDGTYKVKMPGKPNRASAGGANADVWEVVTGRWNFGVGHITLPTNGAAIESSKQSLALESGLSGMASGIKGTVKNKNSITLNGFPGLEAEISVPAGPNPTTGKAEPASTAIVRIYLVDAKVFMLFARSVSSITKDSPNVKTFYDSFVLNASSSTGPATGGMPGMAGMPGGAPNSMPSGGPGGTQMASAAPNGTYNSTGGYAPSSDPAAMLPPMPGGNYPPGSNPAGAYAPPMGAPNASGTYAPPMGAPNASGAYAPPMGAPNAAGAYAPPMGAPNASGAYAPPMGAPNAAGAYAPPMGAPNAAGAYTPPMNSTTPNGAYNPGLGNPMGAAPYNGATPMPPGAIPGMPPGAPGAPPGSIPGANPMDMNPGYSIPGQPGANGPQQNQPKFTGTPVTAETKLAAGDIVQAFLNNKWVDVKVLEIVANGQARVRTQTKPYTFGVVPKNTLQFAEGVTAPDVASADAAEADTAAPSTPAPSKSRTSRPAASATKEVSKGTSSVNLDGASVEELLKIIANKNEHRRVPAAEKLAENSQAGSDPEVAKKLVELLKVDELTVRAAVARALEKWATPEVNESVLKYVSGGTTEVRQSMMRILATKDVAGSAAAIAKCLADKDDRQTAIVSLMLIGEPAQAEVIKMLSHKDSKVKLAACEILKEIGTADGLAALKKATETWTGTDRLAARKALQELEAKK